MKKPDSAVSIKAFSPIFVWVNLAAPPTPPARFVTITISVGFGPRAHPSPFNVIEIFTVWFIPIVYGFTSVVTLI